MAGSSESQKAEVVNGPTTASSAPPRNRWRWQWSLTTLLLLTSAIAAWVGWRQVTKESEILRKEIAVMQRLRRQLIVDDPQKYAVIELLENWHDEDRWDVHLPAGHEYRLKLATRGIEHQELPTAGKVIAISPGRHQLEVLATELSETKQWEILVKVDDRTALSVTESKEWRTGGGSSDNVGYDSQHNLPIDKPLVLKRRRLSVDKPDGGSTTPDGPANGIVLWIETSDARE